MEFTKEQLESFERYLEVRDSGVTNMFNRDLVCELANLTKDEYRFIYTNFHALKRAHCAVNHD